MSSRATGSGMVYADEVARIEGLFGFGGAVVDEDVPVFDEGLQARARVLLQLGGEVSVEAGLRTVDFEGHSVAVF